MAEEEYNGWSNRETWAVNLHLSNNEGDYSYMLELANDALDMYEETEAQVGHLAYAIETHCDDIVYSVTHPEDGAATDEARMFVADVGSLWRVDFYDIAERWLQDAREGR